MLRRSALLVFFALVALSGALYLFNHAGALAHWPWERQLSLVYPQTAVLDGADRLYVIDNSERRLVRLEADNRVSLVVEGGVHDTGRFFYGKAVAVSDDGASIFVLNNRFDANGFYLVREEILRLDAKGVFREVIYGRDVTEEDRRPTLVQRGRIQGLGYSNGHLHWFDVSPQGVQAFRWSPGSQAAPEGERLNLPDADQRLGGLSWVPGGALVSLKNGEVRVIDAGGSRVIYAAPKADFSVVPWAVGMDAGQQPLLLDLASRSLKRVDAAGALTTVMDHARLSARIPDVANFNYYRFSVAPKGDVVLTNDEAVVVWSENPDRVRYVLDAELTPAMWGERIVFWVVLVVTVALGTLLFALLVKQVLLHLGEIVYQSVMIVMAVAIAAVLSSNLLLDSLTHEYEQAVVDKISNMLQSTPRGINTELFKEIKGIGDFDGESYATIRENFLQSVNYNRDRWNQSNYFAIYRVIDGQLSAFMYLNGSVGMLHPFDWLGDDSVYDQALAGKIATERTVDVTGEWLYGVAPIKDAEGNVVALYETGTDLYAFRLANYELIKGIAIQLATILVVMIFVLIEATYFYRLLRERMAVFARHSASTGAPELFSYSDIQFARPLIFVFFTAITVSLTFIPVLMGDLYTPTEGLSRDVVLALPISLETFFFGVSTIMAVKLIRWLGWRWLFIVGMAISILSLIASGVADDVVEFCIARSFAGLGAGVGYIAVRALINLDQREYVRSEGYSHFYAGMIGGTNVGVVLGSAIADAHGFDWAFYVAALLLCGLLLSVLVGFRRQHYIQSGAKVESRPQGWRVSLAIMRDRRVWVFLSCVILPSYAAGTFLAYYLPLFAEENGLSTADVGRLFIFNGFFIIYLGPLLNRILKKHLGDFRTLILGGWLWGLSLVIFGVEGSMLTMFIVLIMMGITEGFNAPAQNDYFLAMKSSRQMGGDSATAYFELFGKIGETVGPMAFAVALMLGQGVGMTVLGLVIIVSTIPVMIMLKSEESEHPPQGSAI
jgi:predicted MFS family arabinose efflux permease